MRRAHVPKSARSESWKPRLTRLLASVAIGFLVASALVVWQVRKNETRRETLAETASKGQEAAKGPIGGPFQMKAPDGRLVTEKDFLGKFLLVYFGFTYCPDMCPTGLQNIARALDLLGKEAEGVRSLFVTVDPARDTPARLKDYTASFHPLILGLAGTDAQLAAIAKVYRVYYEKAEETEEDADEYLLEHSTVIYLMDREGRFITTFPQDVAPEKIVAVLHEKGLGRQPLP